MKYNISNRISIALQHNFYIIWHKSMWEIYYKDKQARNELVDMLAAELVSRFEQQSPDTCPLRFQLTYIKRVWTVVSTTTSYKLTQFKEFISLTLNS